MMDGIVGLLSFLKRKDGEELGARLRAPAQPEAAEAPAAPPPALLRDEIIDGRNRLCGYRLRAALPETEFIAALQEAHIGEFAQRRLAVIPLTLDSVFFKRHLPLLAPQTVLLFVREDGHLPPDQLAARLQAIKEEGCKVALSGFAMQPAELCLLDVCDIVFFDLAQTALAQFQKTVRELHALFPQVQLAADGVQSWDEQRMCLSWGCSYCLGDFLTKPDQPDPDAKIDTGRLTAINMLNLLRSDGELDALAEVAKHDPGITFQLLKWANSPANTQGTTITSLAQAIVVLGRNMLYRWLTVSMFRLGANRERDEALLEVALRRARFLETVQARGLSQGQRDELFLVGLLSLFDVLLGMPMPTILASMHLSEATTEVLLRSGGPYGPYLMLALTMERGSMARAAEIARGLEIDPATLGDAANAAFAWAQESLKVT